MWIESHSDVWTHFKTRRLQKALNVPLTQTIGHLMSLWHFTLDNSWQAGDLERWGDDGIEEACRWTGESGVCVTALRDCGYLDGFKVHDWIDYAGELVRKRRTREMRKVEAAAVILSDAGPAFDTFWIAYPRQVRRVEAAKAWCTIAPDAALTAQIMMALKSHTASIEWQRDGGAFIPHPNTWLTHRRWEERLRPAPLPPAAPVPKCASCFSGARLPNSIWCDKCAWCVACDREDGVQSFDAPEMTKGPDGQVTCPKHLGMARAAA